VGTLLEGRSHLGSRPMAAGGERRRRGCCFGPPESGVLLSYVGGRWKVWDEKETAVEASHSDSVETYTAACWAPASAASDAQHQREVYGRLVLGCMSGRVQVWDPRSVELVGPIAEAFAAVAKGSDCAVTCLAASQPSRASVFAGCRAVPDILEVGMHDGITRRAFKACKTGVVHIASSGSGIEWLLSAGGAGAALRLWAVSDIASEGPPRARARLSGPSNPVTCVDVLASKGVVALCGDGGPQVDIYNCTADREDAVGGDGTKRTPSLALSSHEPLTTAKFVIPPGKVGQELDLSGTLSVIGYGQSCVLLWTFKLGGSAQTVVPVLAVSSEELGGRVLCARTVTLQPPSLLIALGPVAHLAFVTARVSSVKGGDAVVERRAIAAPADEKDKVAPKSDAVAAPKVPAAASAPTVLGPLQAAAVRRRTQKRLAPDGSMPGEDDRGSGKRGRGEDLPEAVGAVTTGISIAPMVRQVLRSGDPKAINKVISNGDRRVMESTVAELSGVEAFDLLQSCTQRLVAAPVLATVICAWTQSILTRHCAYLGSQKKLRQALEPLYDALQARGALHRPLVRLRGQMQMLRTLGKQAMEAKMQEKETLRTPLLEYVEGDEDEDEDDGAEGEGSSANGDGIDEDGAADDDSDLDAAFDLDSLEADSD